MACWGWIHLMDTGRQVWDGQLWNFVMCWVFWDHFQENTQIVKELQLSSQGSPSSVHWMSFIRNKQQFVDFAFLHGLPWQSVASCTTIYCYLTYPLQWCVHAHIQTKSHTETSRTGNETLTCNVAHTFSTWEGTFRGLVPNVKSPCLRRTNECKSTHLELYPGSL